MISNFRFKEFYVRDDKCGMKLTSDAVLLGAYANPPLSGRILDIGSGCGIISLMMAQKSTVYIDAVEIDEAAANQSLENFMLSKWTDRLKVHWMSIQEFADNSPQKYECIISNPPFFQDHLKSPDQRKNLAKHNNVLNFKDICKNVSKLLATTGLFWLILPANSITDFLYNALQNGLFCKKQLIVFDNTRKPSVRYILCMSKEIVKVTETNNLVIHKEDNSYTCEYIDLTKDYYLATSP